MANEIDVVADANPTATARTESEAKGRDRFTRTIQQHAPTDHWERCVDDAEKLIHYAAAAGIDIDSEVRHRVFQAKNSLNDEGTIPEPSVFLAALTQLSKALKPVSADSLRKCVDGEAKKTLYWYKANAFVLALVIIAYSIYAFVASATCEAITKDIEIANALAVTMTGDLNRAPNGLAIPVPYTEERVRNLQQFATTFRAIHARALGMQQSIILAPLLAADRFKDPFPATTSTGVNRELELPANLNAHDYKDVVESEIATYQQVRHYAKMIQERVSTSFGAITTGLLPLLYALLGAMAYLIRLFDAQIRARTFVGGHFWVARLLAAGIAGMVIGMFSGFGSGHGVSLPPLAFAFLVGYAVDPFFAFLDGLVETFTKRGERVTS